MISWLVVDAQRTHPLLIPTQHGHTPVLFFVYSPSNRVSFSLSNPTTTSSPITVTGVVMVPNRSNSSIASSSSEIFLMVGSIPFSRRNFSVLSQNSHPGFCTYSTILLFDITFYPSVTLSLLYVYPYYCILILPTAQFV